MIHELLSAGLTSSLLPLIRRADRTGSSYTCNPPVTTTDVDFLILLEDGVDLMDFVSNMDDAGWEGCSSRSQEGKALYACDPNYSETWFAMRRGSLNAIISVDFEWYARAIAATELCRALNVRDKERRIDVFRVIRDGEDRELAGLL